MANRLRSHKVIDKELKPFAKASGLHQTKVRESLNKLRSSSAAVFEAFSQRSAARAHADSLRETQALQHAKEAVRLQKQIYQSCVAASDAEQCKTSRIFLEFAEGGVKLVKEDARWQRAVSQQADLVDSKLAVWMDDLVALSASAVSDDTALEKALALASGALILAGALGGPTTVIGAAIASAALLARDVAKGATKTGRAAARDVAEVRELKAILLMDKVSSLCERWHAVLTNTGK